MTEPKNKFVLEVAKSDRKYCLEVDPQSPLGELFDALCDMQAYVMKRMADSQPKPEEKEVLKGE
jgi:hypothetical protein